MRRKICLFALLVGIFAGTGRLSAQVHHVPGDYSKIQTAINASFDGDTVLVDRGTYYENINFRGKGIIVASNYMITKDPDDILNTVIDGSMSSSPDTGSCVLLVSGEDSTAVLEGFTLTHGTGLTYHFIGDACNCNFSYSGIWRQGGAIAIAQSSPTIRHNLIINNTTFGGTSNAGGGGGIAILYSSPKIINNVIANNNASYGCGITVDISGGLIANNLIYHNHGGGDDNGGGVMFWYCPGATIENNTIAGNYTISRGGGIALGNSTNITIRNNIVWGNRQSDGTQIMGPYTYCDVEDMVEGEGNINSFPVFISNTFTLAPGSLCIDAGINSVSYNDPEDPLSLGNALYPSSGTLRNDMGAFGGPFAEIMNSVNLEDLYVPNIAVGITDIGTERLKQVRVLNRGTSEVTIDSMKFAANKFYISTELTKNTLRMIEVDSITVGWTPALIGEVVDTLIVYYSSAGIVNIIKVPVNGNALDITQPIAVAGNDTTTTIDKETITLDGSASFDNNELPLKYLWTLVDKPVGSEAEMLYVTNKKGILKFDFIGEYFVTLEVNNSLYSSMTDTIIVTVVDYLSVENPELIGDDFLTVYPNPIKDILYISLNAEKKTRGQFILSNVNGEKITEMNVLVETGINTLLIDMKSLEIPAGVYFMDYTETGKRSTKKIIYLSDNRFD